MTASTPEPSISTQDQTRTGSIPLSPSKRIVKFGSEESQEEGIKPSSPMVLDSDTQSSLVAPSSSDSQQDSDKMHSASSTNLELHSSSQQFSRKRSGSIAIHMSPDGSRSVVLSKSDSKVFGSQEEEFIAGLTEPELITTKEGRATIRDLFLPPPPAPDITHIITPSLNTKKQTPSASRASLKSPNLHSVCSVSPRQGASGQTSPPSSVSMRSSKRRNTEMGSQVSLKSKEKLFQPKREKYCAAGKKD